MSCGTQVEAKEWFLRSNKGIIALRQAEHQMPWPTDHKPMRTRWVTFHEQKWVRSRERRGRSTKAAANMHTLLDLRGNIPSFIHISDGKLHDVHALDMLVPEAGAIDVMDRGYVDSARLHGLHQAGAFFVTRAKSNLDAQHAQRRSGPFTACALQGPRNQKGAGVPYQSDELTGIDDLRAIQKPLAGGAFLQVDQAASPDQEVLWEVRECGEDPDMDRRIGLRAGRPSSASG